MNTLQHVFNIIPKAMRQTTSKEAEEMVLRVTERFKPVSEASKQQHSFPELLNKHHIVERREVYRLSTGGKILK